jgi:Arc/MetJ family transcription regulator
MSKHLVEIDSKLLQQAKAAAGTKTIRATVEAGLRELANRVLFERHLQRLKRAGPEMRKHFEAARNPRFS